MTEVETYGVDMLDEISKYIFTSKYARYNESLRRRETWDEAVTRLENMHLKKYNFLDENDKAEIKWALQFVRDRKVFPSMRSLQFGGEATFAHNARIYNCAVRHIDSIRSFAEVFYLLLCGCGVGAGLSKKYLGRLPNLVGPQDKSGTVITYVIEDSIEGWADSIEALLNCYFVNTAYSGRRIIFDYSKIRPKGAKLKTGGGKAPGYEGLKAAHIKIKQLLDTIIEHKQQTRLKSIDAYDIMMHTSDAVLSGGIRRSAMSIIFELNDIDMLMAKTGNWFEENPQRARSNNSVRLLRGITSLEDFKTIATLTKEWGEPGFVWADHEDVLFNPCFEISFIPVTEDGVCGVQFCNLTSINGAMIDSQDDYLAAAKAAAIIGSLQAGYTNFPYLSNAAKQLTEEEALLGVSMTAMMDNPEILLHDYMQRTSAEYVVATNQRWAPKLRINPAARATSLKPEGTTTLVGKSMASGIHGWHARIMFRRIQANKVDNVYRFFKQFNPHMTEPSVWSANNTDDVICFPVLAPESAMLKSDLTALQHLEIIKSTQHNWVMTASTEHNRKPIHNNVSCTVVCKPEEWDDVFEYIFEHRESFAAVSLIAATSDKDYQQAPNEAVTTEQDFLKFTHYLKNYIPIDYRYLEEADDTTEAMAESSCAGGACEVR